MSRDNCIESHFYFKDEKEGEDIKHKKNKKGKRKESLDIVASLLLGGVIVQRVLHGLILGLDPLILRPHCISFVFKALDLRLLPSDQRLNLLPPVRCSGPNCFLELTKPMLVLVYFMYLFCCCLNFLYSIFDF